ncbi:MAG: PhzF family phenazine biosynthesis protein [Pseudomonadota bacterium]
MPSQPVFHVNAFTSEVFSGNPALVCPLENWLDEELMMKIALESGLTCSFFVGDGGRYRIRWFTPETEINGICGHGTLAAAAVIIRELADGSDEIAFSTAAGDLRVRHDNEEFILDFPSLKPEPQAAIENLEDIFGLEPEVVLGALDLLVVLPKEDDVRNFDPNMRLLGGLPRRAVTITARGEDVDFVSRWFGPKMGSGEDAGVTGSAHCMLVPYWADRLGKTKLVARQLAPRGGSVSCELYGDRVWIRCSARTYMRGELFL